MRALTSALLTGSLLLAACATTKVVPPGSELAGRSLRVEAEGAPTLVLRFQSDGSVVAGTGAQQAVGRWEIAGSQICLDFPRQGRDCWAYERPFVLNSPVTLTSTSGGTARVTLIE